MRKVVLGLFGLLVLALPQVAGAQQFGANHRYAAKFICGYASGSESRLGAVQGHYNTTINIQAIKNRTAVAFRATAISSDLEVEWGVPSEFSGRTDLDRDWAVGLVCRDIKQVLIGGGQEGYVEGYVNVYSTKPLNVVSVLTGQGENGVSVMQLLEASPRSISQSVEYQPLAD